ncbi:MAG: CHAD domain-containing protein [Chloroflexi bacterium]|nr:CHAD domain-containing protein [Chloroflexota bacterium]
MSFTLSDEERALLLDLRDSGKDPEAQRAQVVLMSEHDLPVAQIAESVGLTTRQVHYWRRRWQADRSGIFDADRHPAAPDTPREAPAHRVKSKAVDAAPTEIEPAADVPPRPGIDVPRLPLELRDNEGILPNDAMSEAGRKALLYNFERMLLNEPGSRLGENIEAVHDMRVATRRMRSALRIFLPFFVPDKITPIRRHLRDVAFALGEVRDMEVFLDKARQYAAQHPEADLSLLLETWQQKLDQTRLALITQLDNKKFGKFIKHFHKFLTTPGKGALPLPIGEPVAYQAAHVVPRLLYERYEKVRSYETVLEGAPITTLHALRIEFKRLRYALEFFEEILGSEAKAVIKEVKIMQDHLGEMNDTEVAIAVLNEFIDEIKRHYRGKHRHKRPNLEGVRAYIDYQQAEQTRLLESFPAAWNNFNRPDVRQKFALAVAVL